jgi:hypothetical protein
MKKVSLIVILLFSAMGAAQEQLTKAREAALVKWRALIPIIENVLEAHNLECPDHNWETRIADAADFFSGDHMSVALVNWCYGGAYTDSFTAMNLEGGKPVLSRFLNANNHEEPVEFGDGSSAMHSVGVELVPEKNAILDSYCDYAENQKVFVCKIKAYVWSPNARAFRLDMKLSRQATQGRNRSR